MDFVARDVQWLITMLSATGFANCYGGHYLAAFAYWFNRRFYLRGLLVSLIVDLALTTPATKRDVRSHAEAGF